jgi:hypothetical protein
MIAESHFLPARFLATTALNFKNSKNNPFSNPFSNILDAFLGANLNINPNIEQNYLA